MKEIFDKGMKRTENGIVMERPISSTEVYAQNGSEQLKFASIRACGRYFGIAESTVRYRLKKNLSIKGFQIWTQD